MLLRFCLSCLVLSLSVMHLETIALNPLTLNMPEHSACSAAASAMSAGNLLIQEKTPRSVLYESASHSHLPLTSWTHLYMLEPIDLAALSNSIFE